MDNYWSTIFASALIKRHARRGYRAAQNSEIARDFGRNGARVASKVPICLNSPSFRLWGPGCLRK